MPRTENEVMVTPALAEKWLKTSKGNRTIRKSQVAKLRGDMEQGRFLYNGDRISFFPDGTLFDGHHRLTACVESGVPIKVDTFIIDPAAKSTKDKGASRTTSDNFVMELGIQHKQAAAISAAVRMATIHDNTYITDWARPQSPQYSSAAQFLTQQALESYLTENMHSLMCASAWSIENVKLANTLISKSQSTVFFFLAGRMYGDEAAVSWLEQVILGLNVNAGTTADHIRNGLMAAKMQQRKMRPEHKLYSIIKGFKSVMAGRSIKHAGNAMFRPAVDNVPRLRG